jgi:hypothetical protein
MVLHAPWGLYDINTSSKAPNLTTKTWNASFTGYWQCDPWFFVLFRTMRGITKFYKLWSRLYCCWLLSCDGYYYFPRITIRAFFLSFPRQWRVLFCICNIVLLCVLDNMSTKFYILIPYYLQDYTFKIDKKVFFFLCQKGDNRVLKAQKATFSSRNGLCNILFFSLSEMVYVYKISHPWEVWNIEKKIISTRGYAQIH